MRYDEPTEITKGERIEWTRCLTDYPATEWTLQYRFRGNGTGINVDASASGTDHLAAITAAQSATLTAGMYRWQAWIEETSDATNTFIVDQGTIEVRTGFTEGTTTAVDLRSNAKKIVDAIDTALLTDATSSMVEYEIETPAGRRKVKKSRSEAIAQRKYYAAIVANENMAERLRNGGKFGKPVKARMWEQ